MSHNVNIQKLLSIHGGVGNAAQAGVVLRFRNQGKEMELRFDCMKDLVNFRDEITTSIRKVTKSNW